MYSSTIIPVISSSLLLHFLNSCIIRSVFPSQVKIGRCFAIHKKGDPSSLDNYRCITILSIFSRILEKHISFHLSAHLTTHQMIYPLQSGFRLNHSCSTHLIEFTDYLLKAIDDGKLTGCVFLDFSKAFDTVSHNILLFKLKHFFNFSNESQTLIASFLSSRSQYLKSEDGEVSSLLPCRPCGVPQGSVLGPLLFLLFINDLAHSPSTSTTRLFADDSSLTSSSSSITDINSSLNADLKKVERWCSANQLHLNASKTKCLLVGSQQKLNSNNNNILSLSINDEPIDQVTEYKVLGFILDSNVTFKSHTTLVLNRLNSGLYFLKNAHSLGLPSFALSLLYYALMHSHIIYCLEIYSSCSDSHLFNQIETKRKAALRFICNVDRFHRSAPLFARLDWPHLDELVSQSLIKIICLSRGQSGPAYLPQSQITLI